MKFFQDKKSTHKFSGVFRSRIQDENVTMPELALGYFLGPFCALLANAIFVSFLNRFYTARSAIKESSVSPDLWEITLL